MTRANANRAVSLAVALGFVVAAHLTVRDPLERSVWQYRWVTAVGYGHLLGAAVFGWRRAARPGSRRSRRRTAHALATAFRLVAAATLFAIYGGLVARWAWLVTPMLALSVWHIVENDRALGAIYARPGLAGVGVPRALGPHLVNALAALAVVALAGATLEAGAVRGLLAVGLAIPVPGLGSLTPWLSFSDVFSTVTAYHLTSWLMLSIDRIQRRAASAAAPGARAARSDWAWLAGVHALPAGIVVALGVSVDPRAESLGRIAFSPGIYLFWSVAHVVQTAVTRGLEPRASCGRAAAA